MQQAWMQGLSDIPAGSHRRTEHLGVSGRRIEESVQPPGDLCLAAGAMTAFAGCSVSESHQSYASVCACIHSSTVVLADIDVRRDCHSQNIVSAVFMCLWSCKVLAGDISIWVGANVLLGTYVDGMRMFRRL